MYSLLPYNTFGIDVSAARFLEYSSVEELKKLIVQGAVTTPFLHIGGGSNLLFTKDYDGLILHSRIEGIEVTEEDAHSVSVRVGAGVVWDDFVAYCVEHGWYGAENLSLIPGEVGASAVQNIGAYGVEVKDLITAVETVNIQAEERVYLVEECGYTYRNSIFKYPENKSAFVTYVRFRLSKEEHYTLDYGTIRQELEKYPSLTLSVVRKVIIAIRESKLPDPKVMGNAGSFFMNPIVPKDKTKINTMKLKIYLSLLLFSFLSGMVSQGAEHPKREFRGAWIHTVGQSRYMEMNRDAMQDYFDQMLDSLQHIGINAVIFQVRPTADAFYRSELEPWSKYLTGKQGVAPEPLWDPLQYMIEQCHARNMELHAWLNPYRVGTNADEPLAASHIYHKHPEWFVRYGRQLYFDPGLPDF